MINTNTEEFQKLVEKSRRGLTTYLKKDAAKVLSEDTYTKMFRVINEEFRKRMHSDPEFRNQIEHFCSQRRKESEKDDFYFGIMQQMAANRAIKDAYIKKYGSI